MKIKVNQSICLPAFLSVCLSVFLSDRLAGKLSGWLAGYLFILDLLMIEDLLDVVIGDLVPCEIVKVGTNTFLLEVSCGTADDFTVAGNRKTTLD